MKSSFSAGLKDFSNLILSAIIAPIHLIATNETTVKGNISFFLAGSPFSFFPLLIHFLKTVHSGLVLHIFIISNSTQ